MKFVDVNLWINYHTNPKTNYSSSEVRRIIISEFVIDLLVPNEELLNRIDIDKIKNYSFMDKYMLETKEAEYFGVPQDVISIKIDELLNENINKIKEEKKEGKIRTLINKIKKH